MWDQVSPTYLDSSTTGSEWWGPNDWHLQWEYLLNRLLYECKFNDGTTKEYAANTMASIFLWSWTRIDLAVPCFLTLLKYLGEAIRMADKYITTKNGTKRMRQTTVGWKFLVEWANSSQQWIDLKILKESNPVQVLAEYAMARNIGEEPAFVWWVHYILRKRGVMNARVCKTR